MADDDRAAGADRRTRFRLCALGALGWCVGVLSVAGVITVAFELDGLANDRLDLFLAAAVVGGATSAPLLAIALSLLWAFAPSVLRARWRWAAGAPVALAALAFVGFLGVDAVIASQDIGDSARTAALFAGATILASIPGALVVALLAPREVAR